MVKFLIKLDLMLMSVLNYIIITTSLVVTGLILFLVLARFVLGWSVVGVLELATLAAMWLYMSGAIVAARNHEHLVVDFLSISLKNEKHKKLHNLAVSWIMFILSIFFLSLANDMVEWSIKRPQTTAALSIPLIIPQAAIVLAAIFCFVYAIRDLAISAASILLSPKQDMGGF
jgi:TRAP-type C4-dicarboxylate transport system permease small subunit